MKRGLFISVRVRCGASGAPSSWIDAPDAISDGGTPVSHLSNLTTPEVL